MAELAGGICSSDFREGLWTLSRWYRAYEGTVTDAKLAEVSLVAGCSRSVVIATWHAILENAATLNDGGRIDIPSRRVAAILCEPFDTIETVFLGFETVGLIADSTVTAWKKRQFESDNSTERSQKSRAAAKDKEEAAKQQQCNDDATLQEKTETSPYVYVSDRRTLSEKTTDEFEVWYAAYPRHIKRGDAQRAYRAARKTVGPDVLLAGAKAAAKKYAGKDEQFTPYPASWLRGEQWKDEDLQPPKPQEPTSNGGVYVHYGTDQGDAWERDYRLRGKIPPRDSRGGWYHPSEYPEQNVSLKQSDQAA